MTRYSFVVVLVLVSVSLVALFHSVTAFNAAEATIAQIEAEIDSGRLTCQQVIQLFLDRIAAYDQQGPKLNAIIALNQQAIAQAQQLDKAGRQGRSLFCVPVALKDNIDMPGYPTAAASIALNTTYPTSPALLLKRLTDAGAIVIAKVNMAELAFDGMNTNSSLGGQTLNAYNFAYTPMGSSGGTGTAIAASYAVIGIGSDTNGSIQNPSSVQNLVGLRSTQGLISSIGVFPLLDWQDVAGPMTRTVEDLARVMDVIDAGSTWARPSVPYSSMLSTKALQGARIGVLQSTLMAQTGPFNVSLIPSPLIVEQTKRVAQEFAQLGASVTLVYPNVSFFLPFMTYNTIDPEPFRCAQAEERSSWDYYFQTRTTASSPIKSAKQMLAAMQAIPNEQPQAIDIVSTILAQANPNCTGIPAPGCIKYHETNQQVARFFEWMLEYYKLDAIIYPPSNQAPLKLGVNPGPGWMSYSLFSALSGLPALVFQTGFTSEGVPLGMTITSHAWSEARLIRYAYAYQSRFNYRKAPASVPPLM